MITTMEPPSDVRRDGHGAENLGDGTGVFGRYPALNTRNGCVRPDWFHPGGDNLVLVPPDSHARFVHLKSRRVEVTIGRSADDWAVTFIIETYGPRNGSGDQIVPEDKDSQLRTNGGFRNKEPHPDHGRDIGNKIKAVSFLKDETFRTAFILPGPAKDVVADRLFARRGDYLNIIAAPAGFTNGWVSVSIRLHPDVVAELKKI